MLSKIVVVVRTQIPTSTGILEAKEERIYENASAINNDRGELIIRGLNDEIAVFKEWLYWEKTE